MSMPAVFGSTRVQRFGWLLLRVSLAAVFIIAGFVKLRQAPETFADSIASFRLLPLWAVQPLALGLPPFEILAGVVLLMNKPRRLGAFCTLLLSVAFLVALVLALVWGISVDCGCFGSGPSWLPLSAGQQVWLDLIRDVALAAGALILYRHDATAGIVEPLAGDLRPR